MAESSCDAAVVAVTIEGSLDGISHQTQVSPHVIVDVAAVNEREVVDLDSEWVNSIKGKTSREPRKIKASFSSCSIHRIPPNLRHFDEKNYVPQIISIGPLHYDKRREVLHAMEEHKWRYLHAILCRIGEDCFLRCLRKVEQLEEQARECYSEEIGLDSKSFVEMLVLDACFIIELFCRFDRETCSVNDDPILNLVLCPTIVTDLIMLENQIPFFILQKLSELMGISDSSLPEMAYAFFSYWSTLGCVFIDSSIEYRNLQCHHLLHFLHLNCLHSFVNEDPPSPFPGPIPCASELQEAGIEFKQKGDASSFLQIEYREGKIEIPPLIISLIAEPMLLNLVSFEQCCAKIKPHITSYIFSMDSLINSARDVKILSQKGIIIESCGRCEVIAALFNKIGSDIWMDIRENYLNSVSKRIKKSTKRCWPKVRATLMRDYFNNPWAFISFLAAVVLLVFTFFQTFFSAFPKFQLLK